MKTMKAVRIHTYGGPEVLKFEDAPRPEPAPGEVLIKVNAAGVNPIDWKIRAGYVLAITVNFDPEKAALYGCLD
jgi:NADPH:quinone reductase-like Zn-dependent oxidoreductase